MSKLTLLAGIFVSSNAYAYLDPGTGSVLIYLLIGLVTTIIYSGKEIFYKVQSFLTTGKVSSSLAEPKGADILFYSEGGKYWNVFYPVIKALMSRNIPCIYYTEDENDPGLKHESEGYQSQFIGTGMTPFVLMNKIDVPVVAMTTPQLDVMQLKRSKKVKHYSHILHAPTDALMYRKFAFDYFDSVMCSSEAQIKSIRALEGFRGQPEKKLCRTGLTYYDVLSEEAMVETGSRDKILIAPTWKSDGMLELYGVEPIKRLLNEGEKVIIRPHPQIYISKPKVAEALDSLLNEYKNLELDRNPSPVNSMKESKIMISDMSGIIFDYLFLFQKPVLLVESKIDRAGYEAEDVEHPVWEFEAVKEFAHILKKKDLDKIFEKVSEVVAGHKSSDVSSFMEKSIFHFGHAGEKVAESLVAIADEVRDV